MTLDNIKLTEEESLVDELRRRVKGQMNQEMYEDDHVFKRFLRARNHNIDAAETMLKNHINFRRKNKVDTILTEYTPHPFMTSNYITISRLGFDLEGAPLTYLHVGGLDTKGILNSVPLYDIQLYIVEFLETEVATMKRLKKEDDKYIDKWVFVFNFENFSLTSATHKATLEAFISFVTIYEGNYPEFLKTAYAINASYYFTILWMFIRQFLSPATVKKIRIFGKTGWQEELKENIHPDVLPAFIGGSRTDPDGNPTCNTFIRYGGTVPEHLYSYCNQTCANRLPGAKKLTVSRRSKAEVSLHVLYPGSTVEWEFVVRSRDVGLCVLYKGSSSDVAQVVIPPQRFETAASPESGMYQCEKAGIYIIEFDNTYSWMHSKEIYYTASVVNPRKEN